MTNKEFYREFGNIDPKMIEAAAPAEKVQKKKKNTWIKWVSMAACFALIVSTIIVVPMLREDDPGGIPGPGTDIGTNDPCTEPIPDTGEVLPDFAFSVDISDPQFTNYEISGFFCEPEKVGDYFGESTVAVSFGPDNISDVSAEVYKVVGVDSDLCLCIRYTDNGYDSFYRDFLVYDAYYFIYAKSYSFASLDDMRSVILEDGALRLPNYFYYSKNSNEDYYLNEGVLDELKPLLISVDGESIDTQGGKVIESVHAEANEYVSASCSFEGEIGPVSGGIRIYDSGYLYFSAFGGQLFEIGQENAQKIIDYVITKGVTERYEWIESDGKWYPIIYDDDAEYSSFKEALYESKLYGQIYFAEEIAYWANVYQGGYPDKLNISRKSLSAVAEILSDAVNILSDDGGQAVEIGEIPGVPAELMLFTPVEAVIFTHLWGNGDECVITVYDSGHVELNGCYYFIGTDFTNRIINVVHSDRIDDSN